MAQAKRKPIADTETLLAEAHAGLAAVDSQLAELDAQRLEIEPADAVTKEIALAAARKDAERRVALIEQRAADELRQRQVKAQAALIGRVEATLAKRDQHIGKMADHLENAVSEMQLAKAANSAAMTAWPFDVTDLEACLFGLYFRAAIRHELYRLSGNPYESADKRGDWDFPGAECPTPFRDIRPESVRPLVEKSARSIWICSTSNA